MATPNSPFGPPAGGSGPAGAGASPRQLRPLPPPVPTDLDAKLGALLAEGSAGVTAPVEPRRRGAATLILGGALVIGAGLGLGWGIGRATRAGSPGAEVTSPPALDGQTARDRSVSDAPPSADPAASGAIPPTIESTSVTTTALQPPTAFAVLDGGRLTVRGTFVDQAALDQAITSLSPLGTNGFAVEALVDPEVVGSRQVPVLVSDAALFPQGSAILGDGAQPVLDLFASVMAAGTTSRLIIEGHTDSQGSEAYNFALSQQRVAAVFAYLTTMGIDPARLELAPRGETEPVADNGTNEGRSRNRRVELIFAN